MSTKAQWETLANEAIADAGAWKAKARQLQNTNGELLAALQTLMAGITPDLDTRDCAALRSITRAAITKAEGRS